jgi:hypothetical protein
VPKGAWALSLRFRIGPRSVSFRQACMNLTELIGIAGCPLESGRRRLKRTKVISAKASQREGIQRRFECWRSIRKRCSPIPENLWSSAVEMARERGLNRTARTLRLNTTH